MPDLLEQGSNWLEDQRTKHATRTVAYQRGASSVEVAATIGRTEFETVDDHGRIIKMQSRDFLILTAELILDGQAALPKRGDRVVEEAGGVQYIYEVMAPPGEPHYRFSDPYRKTLRIHTKLVERTWRSS